MRSLPWVKEVQARYADRGLRVIGIHSPEFDYEKDVGRIKAFVEANAITYPNLVDNDHAYWRALGNSYWPAVYLVDREGRVRYLHIGETHSGSSRARDVEKMIRQLLAEPAPSP